MVRLLTIFSSLFVLLIMLPTDASATMHKPAPATKQTIIASPAKVTTSSNTATVQKGAELRHAYKPFTVTETKMMRARINNSSDSSQQRLVCVEAFNNVNGAKTHLGCLQIHLAPMNSNNPWAQEFDAPTSTLTKGNYTVAYSYQAADGNWHGIKSMDMRVTNGTFSSA